MDNKINCCKDLFNEFEFQDLRYASPPDKKGVYVIRIKKEGSSTKEIIQQVKECVQNLHWKLVIDYILNRIYRLKKINRCPIIYIGSAGLYKGSKNTLNGNVSYLGITLFWL